MQRVSAAAFVTALAIGLSCARAAGGNQTQLLAQALAAPNTVSYTGIVEVMRLGNREAEASVYRVEHRAPDLTRRIYSAPAALLGDSVIIAGDLEFSIEPNRKQIVETRDESAGAKIDRVRNQGLIRQNYRVVEKSADSFDGRQTVVIWLISKYTHRETMSLRIDKKTKIVLDKQEFSSDGALVSETRFEQVRYGTVAAGEFGLPKGYALVQGAAPEETSRDTGRVAADAGFAARLPRTLPGGFAPVEADLADPRGVRTLHLLYCDGVRTLSLFESAAAAGPDLTPLHPQTVAVGKREARYAEDGTFALFAWSDGSLYYTLVGELDSRELARMARAVAH